MTDKTKTHYDVEDIPPDDPDTKVQLFEQSADAVKGSAEAADWLRKNAELVLGHVFETADKAGDTALAERVNDVWDGVQQVTTYIQRQGAVIAGSKEAVKALKEQRDKVLEEIKSIRAALEEYDTDHPELADYAETLEEMWMDQQWMYEDDSSYDIAFENIREDMVFMFRNRLGMTDYQASRAFDLIVGTPGNLTDEQIGILKMFGATLPKDPVKQPVEDGSAEPKFHVLEDDEED